MANRLKMATVEAIAALVARGWSQRRIARELGVSRETVGRYVALARRQGAAAEASARPGVVAAPPSGDSGPPELAKAPLGSPDSKPAKAPIGSEEAPLGSAGSKPATEAPLGSATAAPESAGPSDACVPSNGGFIALRPPADEGAVTPAAAKADSPGAYPLP